MRSPRVFFPETSRFEVEAHSESRHNWDACLTAQTSTYPDRVEDSHNRSQVRRNPPVQKWLVAATRPARGCDTWHQPRNPQLVPRSYGFHAQSFGAERLKPLLSWLYYSGRKQTRTTRYPPGCSCGAIQSVAPGWHRGFFSIDRAVPPGPRRKKYA